MRPRRKPPQVVTMPGELVGQRRRGRENDDRRERRGDARRTPEQATGHDQPHMHAPRGGPWRTAHHGEDCPTVQDHPPPPGRGRRGGGGLYNQTLAWCCWAARAVRMLPHGG